MVACNTHIKTFGDNKVSVVAKIMNYPMTFCKGTEWEVKIHCTALVTLQALRGRSWQACQWSTITPSTCGLALSWVAW